jgi:hypothetical protein
MSGRAEAETTANLGEEGHGCQFEEHLPLKRTEQERFGSLNGWRDAFACAKWSHGA